MSSTVRDNRDTPSSQYGSTLYEPGVLLSTSPYEFQSGMRLGAVEVMQPFAIDQPFQRLLYSTNRLRVESHQRHQQWSEGAVVLYRCITSLTEKVDALMIEMEHLRNAKTYVVPLTTLAHEPLQMKLNIPATIEGDGEEFTATFHEANVSASGETAADAIANLKKSLVSSYEFFESLPEDEFGPLPARQWEVLRNVLTR